MKAKDIYIKTMPFVWAKLLLWLITIVASTIWAVILGLIVSLAKNGLLTIICLIAWFAGAGLVHFIVMRYFGYLIKAGHVAVITEAVISGQVPVNQIEYGKAKVKERFLTANVYFLIDNLVSGAVKQIQRIVGKVGDLFKFIPGMKSITNIAQFFVEISLGYVDECCLGYTFYKSGEGAFKSACDGVVIYAQNWKLLLANAAKTMLKVLLAMLAVVVVFTILFSVILSAISQNVLMQIIAFGLACIIALAVKSAFLDSYILVQTMAVYMDVAPDTAISFNLYDKFCGLSKKFKELFNKAKEEQPSVSEPSYTSAGAGAGVGVNNAGYDSRQATAPYYDGTYTPQAPAPGAASASAQATPAFCSNCGAKLTAGTKFCGGCGKQI